MPRGLIVKPGRFQRRPSEYRAIAVISQKTGKWEHISVMGYVVLCPTPEEAHECVRYCGPRFGFNSPSGVIDDEYERWLLRHFMRIESRPPTWRREMLFAEFTRGWIPSPELLASGRSSPGIIDGVIEPQYEHVQPSVVASAISASMGF